MRNRQRGVTAIGWLILLTPFAIVDLCRHPPGADLPQLHEGRQGHRPGRQRSQGRRCQSDRRSSTAIDKHFEIDMVEYPERPRT